MFHGRYFLGEVVPICLRTVNVSGQIETPDQAPRMDVYSPASSGLILSAKIPILNPSKQSGVFHYPLRLTTDVGFLGGSVTAATNASPIVITSNSHSLKNGQQVGIFGALGNTAANGIFSVANVTANTFELTGSTGNGTYAGGAQWGVTGLYSVFFEWTVSAAYRGAAASFEIVPGGHREGSIISMGFFRPNLERDTLVFQTDARRLIGLRNPSVS